MPHTLDGLDPPFNADLVARERRLLGAVLLELVAIAAHQAWVAAPRVMRLFAFELRVGLVARRIQSAALERVDHRATGLAGVAAIAEATASGERDDFVEGGVEPLVCIPQTELTQP